MIGLGEAGKNIVKLFKPHTSNYKIIIFDENDGFEPRSSVEEYDEQEIKLKQRGLSKHDEAMLFSYRPTDFRCRLGKSFP